MKTASWFGCGADDFTGATDVAAALRRCGLRTILFFGLPAPAAQLPDCDAVVVALKTRSAPVEHAEELEETASLHLLLRGHATTPLTADQVTQLQDRFNRTPERRSRP